MATTKKTGLNCRFLLPLLSLVVFVECFFSVFVLFFLPRTRRRGRRRRRVAGRRRRPVGLARFSRWHMADIVFHPSLSCRVDLFFFHKNRRPRSNRWIIRRKNGTGNLGMVSYSLIERTFSSNSWNRKPTQKNCAQKKKEREIPYRTELCFSLIEGNNQFMSCSVVCPVDFFEQKIPEKKTGTIRSYPSDSVPHNMTRIVDLERRRSRLLTWLRRRTELGSIYSESNNAKST